MAYEIIGSSVLLKLLDENKTSCWWWRIQWCQYWSRDSNIGQMLEVIMPWYSKTSLWIWKKTTVDDIPNRFCWCREELCSQGCRAFFSCNSKDIHTFQGWRVLICTLHTQTLLLHSLMMWQFPRRLESKPKRIPHYHHN